MLEPVPLWARSAPGRRRLRGGTAFLIGLLLATVFDVIAPDAVGILFGSPQQG